MGEGLRDAENVDLLGFQQEKGGHSLIVVTSVRDKNSALCNLSSIGL
jgi:hypothetical protein